MKVTKSFQTCILHCWNQRFTIKKNNLSFDYPDYLGCKSARRLNTDQVDAIGDAIYLYLNNNHLSKKQFIHECLKYEWRDLD